MLSPLGRTNSILARTDRDFGREPEAQESSYPDLSRPASLTLRPPTLLISPTAFKGTLTPRQAAEAIRRAVPKGISAESLPLADGGDGTLEVLASAWSARYRWTRVTGPLGRPVRAAWAMGRPAIFGRKKTAIIEMARASGLALTRGRNRIMEASTTGTGELIRAALDAGCRRILIGVGGTATGEGGAGALQALGLRCLDRAGRPLRPTPSELKRLVRVDLARLDPRLRTATIFVLCDVDNPLLGPRGSARTFGPQKGATPAQVRSLESVLRTWARLAPRKAARRSGAGAAGALAFGLAAYAGARLVPGAPFIADAVGWDESARRASGIVTGEGRIDRTSFTGKVVGEIVRRARRQRHRPEVWCLAGSVSVPRTVLRRKGVARVEALGRQGLLHPARALKTAARRLFLNYPAS